MIYSDEDKQFWEDLYLSGDAAWDLGGSTPIFESISKDISPGKICIIGCGKGHDAVMFAKKNFEVTAIDFAPSAISYLKHLAADAKVDIHAINTDIFNLSNDIRLHTYINKIIGDDLLDDEYRFNQMKDFSHLRFELEYFF